MREAAIMIYSEELNHKDESELYHRNCAECVILAANEVYNLEIGDKTLKALTAFGGGIHSGKTCGALCSSCAVIGILFAESKPTRNEKLKEILPEMIKAFEDRFGSLQCEFVKEKYSVYEKGCKIVIEETADFLEEILAKYGVCKARL